MAAPSIYAPRHHKDGSRGTAGSRMHRTRPAGKRRGMATQGGEVRPGLVVAAVIDDADLPERRPPQSKGAARSDAAGLRVPADSSRQAVN